TAKQQPYVTVSNVRVLLRTRQRKFLFNDGLVQNEPRIIKLGDIRGSPQQLHRAERVVPGQPRCRKAASPSVQPHRARTGKNSDGMIRPGRIPVLKSFGVVPHAVAIDEPNSLCTGDVEHSPINMLWNTGDHLARWRTQSLR